MKTIVKFIRKPSVLLSLVFAVVAAASLALIYYVLVPKFESWQELSQKNSVDSAHLSLLSRNVASFESLDKAVVTSYADIVKTFVPDQKDTLRFLAINEKVAFASGVNISGIQVTSSLPEAAPTTPAKSSESAKQTSFSLVGKVYAQETLQQPTPPAGSPASYSIKVSVEGDFEKIESYIDNLKKADRLLGVKSISITSGDGGATSALVTIVLPLGETNVVVTPEDAIVLSATEKEFLDKLAEDVVFSASPTENPFGRTNPFK